MSGIFGVLGINDSDEAFVNVIGQEVVFEAANTYLNMVTTEIGLTSNVFIERTVELFKERYYLPGGGRLQRRGGSAESAAVRAVGEWDVAYPVEEFGAQIAYTRRSVAQLTVQELQRNIDTIVIQYTNTFRFEILKRLFNDGQLAFVDPVNGSINIEPLANGDTVVYPPVMGSESEATEDHYLESGYTVANISDTNNPVATMVEDLVHHFGDDTGGNAIAIMIATDISSGLQDLTDFRDVPDKFIMSGDNVDIPQRLPNLPGKVIGRMVGTSAAWISEWRWMPTTYMLGIHLEERAPLKQRAPRSVYGLPGPIQLVAEDDRYPFHQAHYETNFGVGAGNRLNGVVMEVAAGGSYTIPTIYQ